MPEMSFDKVLGLVDPEEKMANAVVEIEGVNHMIVGVQPNPTGEGQRILKESMITLQDLFFLEPPTTFEELKRVRDMYKLQPMLYLEPQE